MLPASALQGTGGTPNPLDFRRALLTCHKSMLWTASSGLKEDYGELSLASRAGDRRIGTSGGCVKHGTREGKRRGKGYIAEDEELVRQADAAHTVLCSPSESNETPSSTAFLA